MRKLMMLAAMLAMMMAASVPAFAQTFVDNSETTFDTNVEDSFNDNNIAVNDCDIVQNGGDQSNITGDGNVNINEQEADQNCEANAGDVFYDDDDDHDWLFFYWI